MLCFIQGLWFQHLSPILNRFHDFPFLVLSVSEEADKHRNEHENFVLFAEAKSALAYTHNCTHAINKERSEITQLFFGC